MKPLKLREPDPVMRDWPATDTPMARLFERGPLALGDAEVLSILLRKGDGRESAVECARRLIVAAGSIGNLLQSNPLEFSGIDGEQQARLMAALEICRRTLREESAGRSALCSPQSVRDFLRLTLRGEEREVFLLLLLDAQHRVIHDEVLFCGTLTETSVYPREVVKCALRHNAAAVIFAHNHPSGVAEPSHADELLTCTLKQALSLVGVQTLDHFVVASDKAISFAERGLL